MTTLRKLTRIFSEHPVSTRDFSVHVAPTGKLVVTFIGSLDVATRLMADCGGAIVGVDRDGQAKWFIAGDGVRFAEVLLSFMLHRAERRVWSSLPHQVRYTQAALDARLAR